MSYTIIPLGVQGNGAASYPTRAPIVINQQPNSQYPTIIDLSNAYNQAAYPAGQESPYVVPSDFTPTQPRPYRPKKKDDDCCDCNQGCCGCCCEEDNDDEVVDVRKARREYEEQSRVVDMPSSSVIPVQYPGPAMQSSQTPIYLAGSNGMWGASTGAPMFSGNAEKRFEYRLSNVQPTRAVTYMP